MSFVAVAVTGFNAISQIQAGRFANQQAGVQAQWSEFQADVEKQNALETARVIRRAGHRQQAAANAGYAAAGVQVGQGSADDVEREIGANTEHDTYQALLEGSRRGSGLQTQASFTRIQGSMAQTAGMVNAAGTALGGTYSAMRANGWRTAGPGFSGTQAPAPLEDRNTYPSPAGRY